MELFLFRGDQQTGPYTEVEARALVASSQITRACLAWHEGMTVWLPLEQVVALPKPPPPSLIAKGPTPVPPKDRVQPQNAITAASALAAPSSTIRTVSGVITLILGLLGVLNIGGCVNAHSKLASFQRGDNAMDGVDMLVGTARGMNEGDPLRGVAGLLDKAHSLQDDYEGYQTGAWLCVVGTAVAGGVYRFSAAAKRS